MRLNKSVSTITIEKDEWEDKYHQLAEDYNRVIFQRDAFEHLFEKKVEENVKRNLQSTSEITTPSKRKYTSMRDDVVHHSPLYSEESGDSYSPKSM